MSRNTFHFLSALLVFATASAIRATTCAPPHLDWRPPASTTSSVCIAPDGSAVTGTVLSEATTMWRNGCDKVGSGIPRLVANTTTCNITITVAFDPNPSITNSAWDASFQPILSETGDPKRLLRGKITRYKKMCTPLVLAHEIGHALALRDVSTSGCSSHIMHSPGIGTVFDEACRQADALWDPRTTM